MERCQWCLKDQLYIDYHDNEWGQPIFDSQQLFRLLCLEGQQAGLSWHTILKKRDNYDQAFHHFNPEIIALMDDEDVARLMENSGIIRSKTKIQAIITNARAYLALEASGVSFADYIWSFTNDQIIINDVKEHSDLPALDEVSSAMAKGLAKQGFKYVGPTICYAFMEACGIYNNHLNRCFKK